MTPAPVPSPVGSAPALPWLTRTIGQGYLGEGLQLVLEPSQTPSITVGLWCTQTASPPLNIGRLTVADITRLPSSFRLDAFIGKGGVGVIGTVGALRFLVFPGGAVTLADAGVSLTLDPHPAYAGLNEPAQPSAAPVPPEPTPQQVTTQAMILGAGLASRFEPVSGSWSGCSKPAVPLVGTASVIRTLATLLQRHGIQHLLVNTYAQPESLKAELAQVTGLTITYIDEAAPSGSAGGLLKALDAGLVDRTQPLLVVQGDAVTDANFSALLEAHARHQAWVTLGVKAVSDEQVSKVGILETDRSGDDQDSGFVRRFLEKPTLAEAGDSRLGSIGFYVLSPDAFPGFAETGHAQWGRGNPYDYAMDYFPSLLNTQAPIWAQRLPEPFYWNDIGRPDQYLTAIRDIHLGRVAVDQPNDLTAYRSSSGVVFWSQTARTQAQALGLEGAGPVIILERPAGE